MPRSIIINLITLCPVALAVNVINARLFRDRNDSFGDCKGLLIFSIINCIFLFITFIFSCVAFAYMADRGLLYD